MGAVLTWILHGIGLHLPNTVREDLRGYENPRLMAWVELARLTWSVAAFLGLRLKSYERPRQTEACKSWESTSGGDLRELILKLNVKESGQGFQVLTLGRHCWKWCFQEDDSLKTPTFRDVFWSHFQAESVLSIIHLHILKSQPFPVIILYFSSR